MDGKILICGSSDIGNVRPDNQDTIMINGIIERKEVIMRLDREGLFFKHHGLLCAVADGIGGHKGGAMASHQVLLGLATEMICFSGIDCQESKQFLEMLALRLHNSMNKQGDLNPGLKGMGTTLTGVYLRPDWGFYFHAGDSRVYRFRGDFLIQLTTDHVIENTTGVQGQYIEQGSKSGIITNCIGGGSSLGCRLETGDLSMEYGDILMLCSDGLSDMLSLEKMEELIFAGQQDLVQTSRDLISEAKQAGGQDNISLILIASQRKGGNKR